MSTYHATVEWQRGEAAFRYESYPRGHRITFEDGIGVAGAAARGNVPGSAPWTPGMDPEQAFVASLSSCHMLWFLHIAAQAGHVVDRYVDAAEGVLEKDRDGRMSMTRVTLHPAIAYAPGTAPTPEAHEKLHHKAHEKCFIANSVKSEVRVEPTIA